MGLYRLFRYYRYHPGQNFAPHVDHTVYDEEDESVQSRYTVLCYLSDDFVGGETAFTQLNLPVKPKAGSVLVFRHDNEHQGVQVVEGVKYAGTLLHSLLFVFRMKSFNLFLLSTH